jgi:hypothetical protein
MTMKSYLLSGILLLLISSCFYQPIDNPEQLVCIKGTYSVQAILHKIEDQTGKRFFYANSNFDDQEQITVDWNKRPLSNVLDKLLKDKKLHWNTREKIVVLCADSAVSE